MRLPLLLLLATLTCSAEQPYKSPYDVKFTFSDQELIGDLKGARGDWKGESTVPHTAWYSPETLKRYGSWGPVATHYAAPAGLAQKSREWMEQRVIATALRYRGYRYQHHHIPDWEPPAAASASEPLGKGLDCSNFTAFAYNQALGYKFSGGTKEQSVMTEVTGPGPSKTTPITRVELPKDYADYAKTLRTGDLVFINGRPGGEVTHVVLWVGSIGRSRDGSPLILDSTGEGRKDENGADIPNGVQLRPFSTNSWYYRSASHVLRIIPAK